LTTFEKLSNLDRSLRFDNFRKVVKSRPQFKDLTTFEKLSNLDRSLRFDNFRKVVKSRPLIRFKWYTIPQNGYC